MAQESSEASVASCSSTLNWWEIHANPLSPWHTLHLWPRQSHHSDEDISISTSSFVTNPASMDSPSADLSGKPTENHLWNQVLGSVGSGGGDMQHAAQDAGENFAEVLLSKSLRTNMFDPACDYLKKMDSTWEINSLEKQLNSYNGNLKEHERLANLSDLVSNWSIASPNTDLDRQIVSSAGNISLDPSSIKHKIHNSLNYASNGSLLGDRSSSYLPYMHEIKAEGQHHEAGSSEQSFLSSFNGGGVGSMGYHVGLNNSNMGINKFNSAAADHCPWPGARNLTDHISFNPVEFRASSKPVLQISDSYDSRKRGYESSPSAITRGSGRSTGTTSEGKKKRSEENSDILLKKSKHENSSASSAKLQVPKVKLGDRISALQQIASPFGKTDTASVLMEAINYIRFLQEQVQLLSDSYMKSNANKGHSSWGGMERKEKGEQKLDLRSRGLCLVPISCTPQFFGDNRGPDYWTPSHRGCLYR